MKWSHWRNRLGRYTVSELLRQFVRYLLRALKGKIGRRYIYDSYWLMEGLLWWNSGRGRYDAVANPRKLIYIDPNKIERVTGRGPFPGRYQWQDLAKVRGGSWDRSGRQFTELDRITAIHKRFEENKTWNETGIIDQIGRNNDLNMERWCEEVDLLFESLKSRGYVRDELNPKFKFKNQSLLHAGDEKTITWFDDILIDIGRDGELLFVNGRHRLAILQVLDADAIPVRVCARHREWQEIREQYAKKEEIDNKYLNHPDLKDLHIDKQ